MKKFLCKLRVHFVLSSQNLIMFQNKYTYFPMQKLPLNKQMSLEIAKINALLYISCKNVRQLNPLLEKKDTIH